MATRLVLVGVGLALIGGLAFWMLGGERGARDGARGPRGAVRVPEERQAEPLESAETITEAPERETVVAEDEDVAQLPDEPLPLQEVPEGWPGTCSIFGRLRDESGHAVSADVWLTDERGQRVEADSATGRYRASGLAPGRWWIESRTGVYRPVRESVELFRTNAALEVDLLFRPKQLVTVNLYASTGGSFWEGLSETDLLFGVSPGVVATRGLVHSPEEITAGGVSSFRAVERKGRDLTDPLLGVLEVEEPPPLVVSLHLGTRILAVQTLEPGMSELSFTVDPLAVIELLVTLRFRVVDAAGLPTDRAAVMLKVGETMTNSKLPPSGVLEFDGLEPGECELLVTMHGHSMIKRTVELIPPLVDLGDLQLEPAVGLRGTVVDPEGKPLTAQRNEMRDDVYVQFGRRDPLTGEFPLDETIHLGVDEKGGFGLDLEPGTYLIRARGDWHSRNVLVEVPGEPVVLEVFPPSVVVLQLDSGTWDGWRFEIVDGDGHPARTGSLRGTAPERVELPPGPYALRLTDTDGVPREEVPFELGQEELIVNLAL